jgi:uncharacterized protein
VNSKLLPFIKKFKIDKKFYIYDVNTSSFLKVDEIVYTLIDKIKNQDTDDLKILKKYPPQKIVEAKKEINLMKKKGYFSNHTPRITYLHTLTEEDLISYIKDILKNKLYKITIVLGEICNMRCRYCAYSGLYQYKKDYIKIRESNFHALDYLEAVSIS